MPSFDYNFEDDQRRRGELKFREQLEEIIHKAKDEMLQWQAARMKELQEADSAGVRMQCLSVAGGDIDWARAMFAFVMEADAK